MSSSNQASWRVNLELIVEELKVFAGLVDTLSSAAVNLRQGNEEAILIILNKLQHLCANWWDISKEFFNLH